MDLSRLRPNRGRNAPATQLTATTNQRNQYDRERNTSDVRESREYRGCRRHGPQRRECRFARTGASRIGKNTHENVVFPCSGGFSNVALISSLASLEAVKELGIEKVAIGCLAGLPNNNVPMVSVLARAARKVLTVDGCPNQCARKIVEAAGLKIARSIVVSEDAHVAKHTFRTDVGGNAKPVMEYLRDEDVRRTKQLIVDAIHDA